MKKAVAARQCRQQRLIVRQAQQVARRQWVQPGTLVDMALQKSVDLLLAFGLEDRTGRVDQPAARLEQRPQSVKQLALDRDQRRHIVRSAQPTDVGVAPHDARGGARRIEQDRIEQAAIPPDRRLAGIGRLQCLLRRSLFL